MSFRAVECSTPNIVGHSVEVQNFVIHLGGCGAAAITSFMIVGILTQSLVDVRIEFVNRACMREFGLRKR